MWLPGLILLLFGHPIIVGWWSMLLLPMTPGDLLLPHGAGIYRRSSVLLGVHLARDIRGFLGYLVAYQILISAAAIRGYVQYVLGAGRRWK